MVVVATQLSACVSIPGDGAVRAVGEVVSETSCAVSLSDPEVPGRVLETKAVEGQFAVTFVVPPSRSNYIVSLSCNGATLVTSMVARPQRQPVDFGRVPSNHSFKVTPDGAPQLNR